MPTEIEKKFLVVGENWRQEISHSLLMRQAYLANSEHSSIRVRITGSKAQLNIKSAALTIAREEYEYDIPLSDAENILAGMCAGGQLVKTRHHINHAGHLWEVDEFHEENLGLVIAEIELNHICESFEKPVWLGREVSHLARYYNPLLLELPFSKWSQEARMEA